MSQNLIIGATFRSRAYVVFCNISFYIISFFLLLILTEILTLFVDFNGFPYPNLKHVPLFSSLVFTEPILGNALTKQSSHILPHKLFKGAP